MELPFPEIEEVVGRADSACMVGEKIVQAARLQSLRDVYRKWERMG